MTENETWPAEPPGDEKKTAGIRAILIQLEMTSAPG